MNALEQLYERNAKQIALADIYVKAGAPIGNENASKHHVQIKKIDDSTHHVIINGNKVGELKVKRDWVKSKSSSRIRDKMANVWSRTFDKSAVEKALGLPEGTISREDPYSPFKDSYSDIRKSDVNDIHYEINKVVPKGGSVQDGELRQAI